MELTSYWSYLLPFFVIANIILVLGIWVFIN